MPDAIVEPKPTVTSKLTTEPESTFPKKGTAVIDFTCPPYIEEAKAESGINKPDDMSKESWEGLFPNYLKKDA